MATKARNFAYVLEQAARGRLPLEKLVTSTLPPGQIRAALCEDGRRRPFASGGGVEWE